MNLDESKQFERLVARIEETVAPLGAIVRSPDHIPDRLTGQSREIDASIRYKLGTTDILIVVECRRRNRMQDVTWIEQLATKSKNVGANKTIAVSATPFTAPAYRVAELNQIELRTLAEAAPEELTKWFLPAGGIAHVFRDVGDMECVVFLQCSDGLPLDYGLKSPDCFEPMFYHELIQSPFPAAVLYSFLEMHQPELFLDVPFDGTSKRLVFRFSVVPSPLLLQGREGLLIVDNVRLEASVSYKMCVFDRDAGFHHSYSLPDGQQYQHSAFHGEMFDMPVTFEHLKTPSGDKRISFKFIPE